MVVDVAGPGTFAVEVVGVSRRQDVLAVAAERGVRHAVLILDDDNPHDANAVRVEIDGETCGYLSRETAKHYRASVAAVGEGKLIVRCRAKIVGGFETASGERAHLGLRLDLPPMEA